MRGWYVPAVNCQTDCKEQPPFNVAIELLFCEEIFELCVHSVLWCLGFASRLWNTVLVSVVRDAVR